MGLVLFLFNRCCSHHSFSADQNDEQSNAEWKAQVRKSKESIKKYWINLIDRDFEFLQQHGVSLTKADLGFLRLKPSLVYNLDSVSIREFDDRTSLDIALRLNKIKTVNYVLVGDSIKVVIYAQYLSGTWSNDHGYSGIFPGMGRRLSELIKAKIEFYELDVIAFPSSKMRFASYVFYLDKKGTFVSLNHSGEEVTLTSALLELRERLVAMQ